MDYNATRALVERWLAGETTLAEERRLREFFGAARCGLPPDLEACRPLFGAAGASAAEGPRRTLVLRAEPADGTQSVVKPQSAIETPLAADARRSAGSPSVGDARRAARPLRVARPPVALRTLRRAAAIAAAVVAVAAIGVVATRTEQPHPAGEQISCVVDGVPVTDPAAIEQHTRRTLEMIESSLNKPQRTLARQLDGVGPLLDKLSNDRQR